MTPQLRVIVDDVPVATLPMQAAERHDNGFRMSFGGLPISAPTVVTIQLFDEADPSITTASRKVELPAGWRGEFHWSRCLNRGDCPADFAAFWAKARKGYVTEQSLSLTKESSHATQTA